MDVETFNSFEKIFKEILKNKIVAKHEQYGNSLEDPINVFNGIMNPQLLIDVRVDDKLSRMQQLCNDDPKYWSEIQEIIAYLMWKLVLKEREEHYESQSSDNRFQGEPIESTGNTGEELKVFLQDTTYRRLPNKRQDNIRTEIL